MTDKIFLCLYNVKLGYLSVQKNNYLWSPNAENIISLRKKYPLQMDMFFLPQTEQMFKSMPPHFNDFLSGADRDDIVSLAKINNKDNDFEKLEKISKLDFAFQTFQIKTE